MSDRAYFEPDRFMSDIEDKFVCFECIFDEGLQKFFYSGKTQVNKKVCSYCEPEFDQNDCELLVDVIKVTDLQILLRQFFSHDYNNAVNELLYNHEEGFMGRTTDAYDIINNELSGCVADNLLADFVHHADDQTYTDRDYALLRDHERWRGNWLEFCNLIKHQYRFFFSQVADTNNDHPDSPKPSEFFDYFNSSIIKLEAFTELPIGTVCFRSRVVDEGQIITEICEIGPPPPEFARFANRFSPSGVSMFYAGEDKSICEAEIDWSPEDGKRVFTGKFISKRTIRILDLTDISWPCGFFDPDWIGQYHIRRFFEGMINDMVAPIVKDGREHIDYVPTQVISEYLNLFRDDVEGICFPSSRNNTKKSYVFFCSNENISDWFELDSIS